MGTTNTMSLETIIATATKHYMREQWRLDLSTFGRTRNAAWVRLAGAILERPGTTMTVSTKLL